MNDLLELYCIIVSVFVGAVSFTRLSMLDWRSAKYTFIGAYAIGICGAAYSLMWPSMGGLLLLSAIASQYIASWQLWAGDNPPPISAKKK